MYDKKNQISRNAIKTKQSCVTSGSALWEHFSQSGFGVGEYLVTRSAVREFTPPPPLPPPINQKLAFFLIRKYKMSFEEYVFDIGILFLVFDKI